MKAKLLVGSIVVSAAVFLGSSGDGLRQAAAATPVGGQAAAAGRGGRLLWPEEAIEKHPVTEPRFAAFKAWTGRYVAAGKEARQGLEREGVALARERLTAMADLIQGKPERALELAVPQAVRATMPAAVQALLEEPVNARGDYEVICVLPVPGREPAGLSMVRVATIGGRQYRVFTFAKALEYVTRRDVPLNGLAVPISAATTAPANPIALSASKLLVLDPNPGRLLEASELEAVKASLPAEPLCSATGQPWSVNGTPTAVQFGGRIVPFSSLSLAEDWVETSTAASELETPQPPANLDTAESPYTEGRKRFLLLRVDFADYQVEALSTNSALTLMNNLSNFMAEISYYKHIIAPVGQGSDITPTMRMTQNASAYDNAGLSKLYPEAKNVAATNYGYDISQYDFLFVVTGSRPSYGYAGLGYVGGVGFHLANGYFDVRTSAHEFGHNLGLGHANWWNTGGKTSIGPGSSDEYGDDFDTMGGSGGGVRHYSSYFKNKINWIPNSDCPTITNSGVYRLHAQDMATAPVGVRGLRLTRSGGDYWLEFRQLWTGNKALMNGTSLRWVSGGTSLLDMTPGSAGAKNDHPLTLGRTFSDPDRNYHITPLTKAHTYPESIDVAINIGPFPTNQPPSLTVSASTTNASAGQTLTFAADATDPNGDALAYSWDFGDGDYSTDNSAVTTHSFSSTGEYYVECTVSDMKGGTGRASIVVRVANPTTFRIGGRVLGTNGLPVGGIRVSVDSSHYAFTESAGTYTITRLAAGNYTVTAVEPVTGAYNFLNPFFNNPVTVGPSFATADFIALKGTLDLYVPVIPRGAVWKYLDDGTDQGTNWIAPTFNDAGWSNGAAILGYGQDYESTVIRFGSDANNKYPTYYFRKSFVATNLTAYTNLLLEVLRDDGIIVYLNGSEVFRNNMPAGIPITYTTWADSTVEPDRGAWLRATLPLGLLLPGTNVIAAEVHQSEPTSSDVTFDLALSGLSLSNSAELKLVYISSPPNNLNFASPTNLTIKAVAQSGGAPVSLVEFFADGGKIGEDPSAPYSLVWTNPPDGQHTLNVVATIGGNPVISAPVCLKVAAPVFVPPPVVLSLISTSAVWNYLAGPSAPTPDWLGLEYDHSTWPAGRAELGYGDGGEATVIPYGSDANNKWTTYYFRRLFVVEDPSAVTNLTARLKRDDGAVVYLNGREVWRDNMPTSNPIAYSTFALTAIDGINESTFYTRGLDPSALINGINVCAVEVHQANGTSSDVSFDFGLEALASTNRPRGIWLTTPAEGAVVPLPSDAMLTAQVVVGGTLEVTQVGYFCDGLKIGETTSSPFVLTWSDPPAGAHQLLAVATDSAGGSVTSPPVNISVSPPPLPTALVSLGDAWKYLDDGSNQGTNWVSRTFDDRSWATGPAKFGYGDGGEATTLSYGTNANQRYITAYFRKQFNVINPAAFSGLLLQLVRDDGAAGYLNGAELYRDNIPDGRISFNTLASVTLNAPEEGRPIEVVLSARTLVAGTNILAVEIHQASPTSSDAGFDLSLTGLTPTNMTQGIYLTGPADGTYYNAPARIELMAFAACSVAPVTLVEYFDADSQIGHASRPPYDVAWTNAPAGVHVLTAHATCSTGLSLTSAPVTVVVGPPPAPIAPVFQTYIPARSAWKYWDNAAAVGPGWQDPDFDDSAWPSGVARFGWGWDGEVTLLTEGRITHCFRRWFTVPAPEYLTEILFQLVRDDGAVVYLNGREVFRSNMPAGTVTASTTASTTVNTPDETTYFETVVMTPGSGLVAGSNLVAVELHQGSAASSDAGFDLQLVSFGTTQERVYLTTPAPGASFPVTSTIPLEAMALAPAGASVSRVEFFVDGVKLGETTQTPHRLLWGYPPLGAHVLTARLTDSSGSIIDSTPMTISVTRELINSTFIAGNSTWRYLDDGSNQGTNWAQPGYNDSAWAVGAARLGYGGDGEVTTVRSNRADGTRIITTYFRRTFSVASGATYTNLTFRLLRDDGAVVWVNGREAYRSNMPTSGLINYGTLAAGTVSGADEQTFFTTSLPATNLVAGTNLVAVEVHQINTTSSDVGFGLELTGYGYLEDTAPPELGVTIAEDIIEVSWPASAAGWQLYSAPSLLAGPRDWTPVASPVYPVSGRNVVFVSPDGGSRFYRLGRP